MLRSKIQTVLLLATLVTLPAGSALANPSDEGGEGTTVMTDHRPPPMYRPGPRWYRPAPRRVYVAPAYTPRPRRVIEEYYNPMFHFGIGINGNSMMSANDSDITAGLGSGAGFDVGFGWRIADSVSLDFNWLMSFHDSGDSTATGSEAALTSLDLDLRFFLTDRTRRVQPYVQVGVGAYILGRDSFEFDTLTGGGFQLGGGADFYLTKYVSIGGKLLYRGAYLDNADATYSYYPTESTWLSTLTYGADLKFHF
ncbi:MAG: outer membrane beta-barrel protein [Myxococcota bacterium]